MCVNQAASARVKRSLLQVRHRGVWKRPSEGGAGSGLGLAAAAAATSSAAGLGLVCAMYVRFGRCVARTIYHRWCTVTREVVEWE